LVMAARVLRPCGWRRRFWVFIPKPSAKNE
jgi:hypothetical protein